MKHPVVVLGAGGHATVVIELLEETGEFEVIGCTGHLPAAPSVLGYPYLGSDDVLPALFEAGTHHAFIAIGDNAARKAASAAATRIGYQLVNAVSPKAVVSRRAMLGTGVAVMAGAVINAQAMIQDGSIINTGVTVDHDCTVGSYAHLGPGTHVAGGTHIGEGAFLGVGVTVIDQIAIGRWSVVGAGSVVIGDVPDAATVVGVPARVIRQGVL